MRLGILARVDRPDPSGPIEEREPEELLDCCEEFDPAAPPLSESAQPSREDSGRS